MTSELVDQALTGVSAYRKARAGENLQRIAEAAYGSTLFWPLVWYQNQQSVPDPERFSTGTILRVARMKTELSDPATRDALSVAYLLVYGRYQSFGSQREAQRRWVLRQASSAGVDLGTARWSEGMTASDRSWAASRLPPLPLTPDISVRADSPPQGTVTDQPAPVATLSSRFKTSQAKDAFLSELVAGTPLTGPEMEAWANSFSQGAETESVVALLEAEAAKPGAPPQVSFALSLHYRRLNLVAKEYAALTQASTAADRRPDVVFNILLLNGRKQLLEASGTFNQVMLGSLAIKTNLESAKVTVNGQLWGQGSLGRNMLDMGEYVVKVSSDRYEDQVSTVMVQGGKTALASFTLVPAVSASMRDAEAQRQLDLAKALEQAQKDRITALANIPEAPSWPRKDPWIGLRNEKAALEAQGVAFPDAYIDNAKSLNIPINQVGIGLHTIPNDDPNANSEGGLHLIYSFMAPKAEDYLAPSIGGQIGTISSGGVFLLARGGIHIGQMDSAFGISIFGLAGGNLGPSSCLLVGESIMLRFGQFLIGQIYLFDPTAQGDKLVITGGPSLSWNFW